MVSTGFLISYQNISSAQGKIKMSKEKITELVESLEAEINNGGFDQFFFNSKGDNTEETIYALETIGAKHTANIVRKAAAKFPGGMPSKDRSERQEQLEKISPNGESFEAEDSAFYEYKDDIAALLKSFNG